MQNFKGRIMLKYIFVDDDVIFLNILRAFFGGAPHRFCGDSRDVLAVIEQEGPFDALISDYDMPYKNGLVLAEKVRKLYPDLPIMVVSGHERPAHLPHGIQQWLSKPISLDFLRNEIQLLLPAV